MNKQEVIEEIKNLGGLTILDKTINFDSEMISKKEAFNIINQLDEPEKPVVPQFVADYIEENRDDLKEYVFTNVLVTLPVIPVDDPMYKWLNNKGIGVIVDCIRNGYEVEKEKKYIVKLKGTDQYLCFYADFNILKMGGVHPDSARDNKMFHFTQDKLEKLHYWDSPAFEIKEVKE